MDTKRISGRYAADFVQSGWAVGLGTGSTVHYALERLAERTQTDGLEIVGIPTSRDTELKARALGIPLTCLKETPRLRMTIDGADEVDGQKRLIKGGGGALVREKIVAAASEELVVIVGENKIVPKLGVDFHLPVEVIDFAVAPVLASLKKMGLSPYLRTNEAGEPVLSDNDNRIIDCQCGGIDDPQALEQSLNMIPGVLDNGLFLGLAHRIVVGKDDGSIEVLD